MRKHIEADQNRRNHEMELDSSLETSGTLSPDKDREGKVGSSSSPLRSAEKVNVDATRSMVAIRENEDDEELEYHDSYDDAYDLAEAPTWAVMEDD